MFMSVCTYAFSSDLFVQVEQNVQEGKNRQVLQKGKKDKRMPHEKLGP